MHYDPHSHAAELGLQVEHQSLRTAPGLYIPGKNLIILKKGLRTSTERCVLAHEIQHHLAGDRRIPFKPWTLKQERRADLAAARQLIDPRALLNKQQSSPDPAVWAYELEVTAEILLAYLKAS